jgi:hypothetical protein
VANPDRGLRRAVERETVMMSRFLLGAIVGGIAVYVWGDEIRRLVNSKGQTARLAAVDTLHAVQTTAEQMLDSAKDHVTSTLEAGQEAIRPPRNFR